VWWDLKRQFDRKFPAKCAGERKQRYGQKFGAGRVFLSPGVVSVIVSVTSLTHCVLVEKNTRLLFFSISQENV